MTQRTKIIKHLRDFGSISPLEARAVYGIERLASRIDELRQSGHSITSNFKKDAMGKKYVEYRPTTALPSEPYVDPAAYLGSRAAQAFIAEVVAPIPYNPSN